MIAIQRSDFSTNKADSRQSLKDTKTELELLVESTKQSVDKLQDFTKNELRNVK